MNRNTKIGFGIIASAYAVTVCVFHVRLKKFEELLQIVDKTQDNMLKVMDNEYQKQVDAIFGEIADNYDD